MGKTKGKPDIFTRFATFVPITAPPFPTSGMQPTPYIDIHTHRRSNAPYVIDAYAVGSDGSLPAGPYSAGIHPWEVQRITPDNTSRYRQDLLDALTPRCIAVGEIGLDYAVTGDSVLRMAQRHWFEQQMELAADRSLPVIIHCVRAYNDLIPILRHYPHVTPVIHSFTGSPELAERLLQAGGYLSFGHRTAASPKTRQALAAVPVDRVFFETDESPLPIAATYATAAAITGKTVAEWKETVYDNYRRLFKTP